MNRQKHIHFIGICGVAMSALAMAYHEKGYRVTGSDKGFYPPVSTYLKDAGISYYPGWHPKKMRADGDPDLVIVGNVAGSQNPEWVYVQEHNIPYLSYPEAIAQDFVRETSVVAAGTYGKSTTSALLSWIFLTAGKDPSYMFGGLSRNNIPSAHIGDDPISILEGDEYKSARWDERAKFFHYAPTHLLLTAVKWDHADVYPTEEAYFEAFAELVKNIPKDGLLVASERVPNTLATLPQCTTVVYGAEANAEYRYSNVSTRKDGISFDITHADQVFHISGEQIGSHMADNMTAAFAMAHQLGLSPETIVNGLETFKHIKRRLEKRLDSPITVFDDIAHSPEKAAKTLKSIRPLYDGKIIAVFEPNTGNRQQDAIDGYADAFKDADVVYIPRLSKIKKDPRNAPVLDGAELADTIAKTQQNVHCIADDDTLVQTIVDQVQPDDVIIFLGSHGFRGMIEDTVQQLRN